MISALRACAGRPWPRPHHQHRADREVGGDEDVGRCPRPRAPRSRARWCPSRSARPLSGTRARCERGIRPREVHDHLRVPEHVLKRASRAAGPPARRAPCPRRLYRLHTVCPIRPAAPETATLITDHAAAARDRPLRARGKSSSSGPRRRRTAARARTAPSRAPSTPRADRVDPRDDLVERQQRQPIRTDAPSRFMRATVDSIASTMRPFTFSSRAPARPRWRVSCSLRSSSPIDLQRLARRFGAGADVEPDLAGVHVQAGVGEDRVGQPAPLAHLLEQARGEVPPRTFQHAQREAPLVRAGDPRRAEAEVVLLGCFGGSAPSASRWPAPQQRR